MTQLNCYVFIRYEDNRAETRKDNINDPTLYARTRRIAAKPGVAQVHIHPINEENNQ